MCVPTAAMMFSLCTTMAPAVTSGDESINLHQPTKTDNHCSQEATVFTPTDTPTNTGVCPHTNDTQQHTL